MKQGEKKIRVAIGLSGGVDSSVAAALLKEQGYEVTGVYLTCWAGPGCRSEEDRKDALDIAMQLSMPFVHLDFQEAYKEKVYEYMVAEYEAARTPNPDVVCNREIKFGLFYDWAMKEGYDFVATGHYAQTDGKQLLRSVDEHKDQTYFLYQLREEQLKHILFPIGHLTKKEVREEAGKRDLLTAKKPDSVGICFIGEVPVEQFLKKRIQPKEGTVMMNGVEIGSHHGVWFSTIGQRHGFRVNHKQLQKAGFDPTHAPSLYVTGKDVERNILEVGTEEQLNQDEITVGEVHWIGEKNVANLMVRIRHTGELIPVEAAVESSQQLKLKLTRKARAVAPGQAAVWYQDRVCLGGGILQNPVSLSSSV